MQNKANWNFFEVRKNKFKKKMVRNKMPRLCSCSKTLIKHIVAFSCCFWVTAFWASSSSLVISARLFSLPYSPWNSFWVFINFCVCQINISLVSASFVPEYVIVVFGRCWLQIKLNLLEVTYCCLLTLKYK